MTLENLRYALYLNNLKLLELISQLGDVEMVNISTALSAHKDDLVIHVTKEDKDFWNSILDNAKEYAKSLFDSVTHMNIEIVEVLPEEPKDMVIYFIPGKSGEDSDINQDYYDEYMFINGEWEVVGHTYIDLTPYLQREQFEKIIANYVTVKELATILVDYVKKDSFHEHNNKDVLDKLSVDKNGFLLFDNQTIKSDEEITDEDVQLAILSTLKELNVNKGLDNNT